MAGVDDSMKIKTCAMRQELHFAPVPQGYELAHHGIVVSDDDIGATADLYDISDEWIPIYDKSDLPGCYMAVGTSRNQYKNGPVVGMLMAELIEQCENGRDHDQDPVTISCPYAEQILSAGFYSRNRGVNEDSSFYVLG